MQRQVINISVEQPIPAEQVRDWCKRMTFIFHALFSDIQKQNAALRPGECINQMIIVDSNDDDLEVTVNWVLSPPEAQ